jgi:putative endonuclease
MSDLLQNKTSRQRVGRIGEDAVATRYAEMGFAVVARNRHVSHNEIDLILQNETHLVFVEVKTRHASPESRTRYGRPAAAIDKGKRERMRKAAEDYLREHPTQKQPRIDVSEVYLRKNPDGTDEVIAVKLYPNAFAGR